MAVSWKWDCIEKFRESWMNRAALLPPREAARILGISYPTLKQWIYRGKITTVKTPGGHHRVPESEIDRMIPRKLLRGDLGVRRGNFRKISGRNQLVGRVLAVKYSGLLAQVTMAIGEQHITALITADAAKEMRLKPRTRRRAYQVHGSHGPACMNCGRTTCSAR